MEVEDGRSTGKNLYAENNGKGFEGTARAFSLRRAASAN
jgi:hypothetical protein